jgi:hypothetical protein
MPPYLEDAWVERDLPVFAAAFLRRLYKHFLPESVAVDIWGFGFCFDFSRLRSPT